MEDSKGGEINISIDGCVEFITKENDDKHSEWLQMCMYGVAATNAAAAVWLPLTTAAIALHTSQVKSNPATRASVRMSVIRSIIESESKCSDLLRLSPLAFNHLVVELKSKTNVKDYTRTSIEEQLIFFLLILGHNFKNRVVSFFLKRSGETISRYFHNILVSVITLEEYYVKAPKKDEVQPTIFNSKMFFPYFKDCLGAIDGTHVRVKVSQVDAPRYRGRKEWPTQNVLAACTFDLKFTYILAGWEGSASDSRILKSALTRDEPLIIHDEKYYLGDSGFGLTDKMLTPYGRTRYHLKEYSQRGPETPEELFNHRHSSLRNAIERAFGVLKKRFPIIASGSECQYTCSHMTNIILSCAVLHNFMLTVEHEEEDLSIEEFAIADNEVDPLNTGPEIGDAIFASSEHKRGELTRDRISAEMWADY